MYNRRKYFLNKKSGSIDFKGIITLQKLSTPRYVLVKFHFKDTDFNEITGKKKKKKSKLSARQTNLRPGYFSQQLSVPEGIGIIAAEFKGEK